MRVLNLENRCEFRLYSPRSPGLIKNWHSHPLQKHLQKVAQLAKRFAGRYGELFAEYAGLLHDLGKFQEAFQKYIRNASGFEKENAHLEDVESTKLRKIPHSTAGAKYAVEHLNPFLGICWRI